MAVYCTEAQVESNLKNIDIDADSAITTDDLSDMIAEESAVIEAHIGLQYTLPISNTVALAFLRKICIDLVVWRVTKILNPMESVPINPDARQEISHVSAYKHSMRMLKAIFKGEMRLPGEDMATRTQISSTLQADSVTGKFEKGEEQW